MGLYTAVQSAPWAGRTFVPGDLELTRYVVLNPVRARMVADPAEWPWSNYRAVVGEAPAPRWLDTDWLLGQFGGERMPAIGTYRQFVLAGKGAPSPLNQVQHQMLLGDDAFVILHQQSRGRDTLREVSKALSANYVYKCDQTR